MADRDPGEAIKMTVTERVATSLPLMAYARVAMMVCAFMLPIATGIGAWTFNRFVSSLDKIMEKQDETSRNYIQLHTEVLNIVNDQVKASKNIADRIEQGEKVLNDRINAQGDWARQLSSKIEDLSKYVYTKIR